MFHRKEKAVPDCEHCERCEELKKRLAMNEFQHDRLYCKRVKQDTDIINGLLKVIDALHLLLEKQGEDGDQHGDDGGAHIHNGQNVNL